MNDIQSPFKMMSDRTLQLVQNLEDDEWTYQSPFDSKHPAWVIGHLAKVREFILLWDGQAKMLPSYWDSLFGNNKTAIGKDNAVPKAELLQYFTQSTDLAMEVIGRLDDSKFDHPITESYHTFANKRLGIIFEATVHESIHFGQLKTLVRHITANRPAAESSS